MKPVGIEAINAYLGETYVDVPTLFAARKLDDSRIENLMMARKSVALHCEDAVSFAVNAAKPIVDALTEEERGRIELLIVGTESGVDFGKSLATYVHDYLGLPRSCRLFETKQACYSGTAAVQMAAAVVAASPFDGAKALVISSDVARPVPHTYVEPSQGAGAVAMLISDEPVVASFDRGANGFHSYEVMDTCRPDPEAEAGDVDLSLLSYIDCLKGSFTDYASKVEGADLVDSFDLLAMHTPFPGMVKGAHRAVLRKLKRMSPQAIEDDFNARLSAAVEYPPPGRQHLRRHRLPGPGQHHRQRRDRGRAPRRRLLLRLRLRLGVLQRRHHPPSRSGRSGPWASARPWTPATSCRCRSTTSCSSPPRS
ncbi:hypothetical protein GCM10020000_75690 [Streptomyces olivoverticillatus]